MTQCTANSACARVRAPHKLVLGWWNQPRRRLRNRRMFPSFFQFAWRNPVLILLVTYAVHTSSRTTQQQQQGPIQLSPLTDIHSTVGTTIVSTANNQTGQSDSPRQEAGLLDLVISHCRENTTEWVRNWSSVLHVSHVYIYNKCDEVLDFQCDKYPMSTICDNNRGVQVYQRSLPNVGQEGHTWLCHMLRDDIVHANWTAYLQGNPEYGIPEDIQDVLDRARRTPSTTTATTTTNTWFNFVDLYQYAMRRQVHDPNIPKLWKMRYSKRDHLNFGWNSTKSCEVHERFKNTHDSCSEIPRFTFRGQFMISGELVRRVTTTMDDDPSHRSALELLRAELERGGSESANYGYWLERHWIQVLGARDLDLIPEWRRPGAIRKKVKLGPPNITA